MIRATADATKEGCQPSLVDYVFGFLCCTYSAWLLYGLYLIGSRGSVPISDISSQGEKVVITTTVAHYFLKRAHPVVSFAGTGVPDLDKNEKNLIWKAKATSLYQLTLHCSDKPDMALDTSIGHLHLRFPHMLLSTGMWHCPLILWCLIATTVIAAAASQLTWSLTLVTCTAGLVTGLLNPAWRRRQAKRSPLAKRRRQFFKEWHLALQRCDRGPDRSMTAGKLLEFLQFFDSFIKERSMYYVSSNIVKPLTQPYQLSFAELVGPTKIQWFVSHYWGMPLRHFSDAIRKHASSYERHWQNTAYWICTLSNSQWHVKDELGNGKWQDSSFYLALRSPDCKGTTMIIDDRVLPLQRIWCLFEVYQTILLSQNGSDGFQGLLLCTSAGVLQQGNAGTDVAVAVAKTVAELDTENAKASDESDRLMIHKLIESMDGGFDYMNTFVRKTICKALEASHSHYETALKTLMEDLTETHPTLLTSRANHPETKAGS